MRNLGLNLQQSNSPGASTSRHTSATAAPEQLVSRAALQTGYARAQVHAILTDAKGRNLETKKTTACKTDELTHVYTLHLMPNNTYRILIDNAEAAKGALHEDWDFEAPKQIMARAPALGNKACDAC